MDAAHLHHETLQTSLKTRFSGSSPASRDFRSDTLTTPTREMLESMLEASLGDDVYREDKTTNEFEAYIASLLGHEQAMFVSSGTMSNQLALRAQLFQPPHAVLVDARAHIATLEAGGLASLSQAMLHPVLPRTNGVYLTLEDVKRAIILSNDIHTAPTRIIALENTLSGTIMPLSEVARISQYARSNGVKMHLDGARLWNAVAAGAGSLQEYASHFDSISVCFSKGLGAPIGSMLVSSAAVIAQARWVRKSIGGGMRQIGPVVAAARTALFTNFPGALQRTHMQAKRLEKELATLGVRTVLPVQTSMLFLDLEDAGLEQEWVVEEAKKRGIKFGFAGRIVIHHQITDEAIDDLVASIKAVLDNVEEGRLVFESLGKDITQKPGYSRWNSQ